MPPRQYVVVENKALRRFAKQYGYCLSPGALARKAESLLRETGGPFDEADMTLYSDEMILRLKRRGDQWFITGIDRRQSQ